MQLARVIRQALRADPILQAVVGEDPDGEIKVFTPIAKTNAAAPYVTFEIVPQTGPIPLYGEPEGIEPFGVEVHSWAKNANDAWQIADVVDDALKRGDYSFEPNYLIQVLRTSTPDEMGDRDTDLRRVIVGYRFVLGR